MECLRLAWTTQRDTTSKNKKKRKKKAECGGVYLYSRDRGKKSMFEASLGKKDIIIYFILIYFFFFGVLEFELRALARYVLYDLNHTLDLRYYLKNKI
jgi:hypothetical protein